MRIRSSIPVLALAVAGVLAGSNAAKGATVVSPLSGDIFVGFRATGGDGSSTSYLVKIGNQSTFNGPVGTTLTLSLGNLGADLQSLYGSFETPWYQRADLQWGIFGLVEGISPVVFASRDRGDSLTLNPWPTMTRAARESTSSQINSVINSVGGYRSLQATENSPVAGFQQNTGQASSYAYQVGASGVTDFGNTSGWSSIEGNFGNGPEGTNLDLFGISSTGVQYRGSFAIDEDGVITYSVIPEPSAAALLIIGGAVTGSLRRRRTAVRA